MYIYCKPYSAVARNAWIRQAVQWLLYCMTISIYSWLLCCMACRIYAFLVTVLCDLPYLCIPGDCTVRLAVSIHSWRLYCMTYHIYSFLVTVLYDLSYLYIPGDCTVWLVSIYSWWLLYDLSCLYSQECIDTASHTAQSPGMYRYGRPYITVARNA
jgi:hypothetical protein